jgi:ABC-type bacteriocin/lantibiotic exporter with double-glycine peptidase domain
MTLPFYAQETPESCVPACLRMVLAHWGILETESILRAKCQTTHRGTNYHDAVSCVQSYGLNAKLTTKASWLDLTG